MNMKRIARLLDVLTLTIFLPLLLSLIVYYGFFTNYTGGLFSEAGFRRQYYDGVYQYRILGRELLLWLHAIIEPVELINYLFSRFEPKALYLFDSDGTTIFYGTYFLQNTFFLCLTMVLLYILFEQHLMRESKSSKNLLLLLAVLLMTVTQYVVVPYDTLSYFFLVVAIFLMLRQSWFAYGALLFVLILATITRETAVFVLVFFVTYNYKSILTKNRTTLIKLGGLIVVFLITYGLLRVIFGGGNEAIFEQFRLLRNLTNPSSLASIILLFVLSYTLISRTANIVYGLLFLLLSIPYILMIIAIANPWEVRLWTPIWLGLLIIGQLSTPILPSPNS